MKVIQVQIMIDYDFGWHVRTCGSHPGDTGLGAKGGLILLRATPKIGLAQ